MVVTFPASSVLPPASVVRLVSAVVPPTVQRNLVLPPEFTVSACAPSTAWENVMSPPPVLASIASTPSVTASPYVCAPVVRTPPPSVVLPPALVVRLVNAVVAPTAAPKLVLPPVFTVSACAPSTVEPKAMLPLPALASVASTPSVTVSL